MLDGGDLPRSENCRVSRRMVRYATRQGMGQLHYARALLGMLVGTRKPLASELCSPLNRSVKLSTTRTSHQPHIDPHGIEDSHTLTAHHRT